MSTNRIRIVVVFALLLGCGGRAGEQSDTKPAEECTAYAGELQACLAKIGAARPIDQLSANAAAPRDEATRTQMNADCARSRAQLRASCK